MLLAIDARNRALSIGFRSESAWLARRQIAASSPRSADEYALLLHDFARDIPGGVEVDSALMSSVVPSLNSCLRRAVETAFGIPCPVVGPGTRTGLRIRTDTPSELGSDLVCQAIAAFELVGQACVVVDFDAAVSFSAIGRSGEFLGAAIAPGLEAGAESLHAGAALLPEASLPDPGEYNCVAIGKNTAQSLRAGLIVGYAGLVERIAGRQAEELVALGEADSPGDVALLVTGGEEAKLILASLGTGRFVPDLALEGLAIIASRASPKTRRPI